MRPLMVQGTSSGAGKTLLVTALCRIFSDMGYGVAPFKAQNMSNYAYCGEGFEIAQAQALQAAAARCEAVPDLNPILLKPCGDSYSHVYLRGMPHGRMHAREYYDSFATGTGLEAALESLQRLKDGFDLVILEGAGSPAEINMRHLDIANMRMASAADACVLIVSDIDRGGSFASLAGTFSLLEPGHRSLVRGFVLNKFRGDARLLESGMEELCRITGVSTLGVVPMLDLDLPKEDSLDAPSGHATMKDGSALDAEIDRLAAAVSGHLNMDAIAGMVRGRHGD